MIRPLSATACVVAVVIGASIIVPSSASAAVVPTMRNCGNTSGRLIPTIDDWPYEDTGLFQKFAIELERRGVKAIFFPISNPTFTRRFPDYANFLRSHGHYVGNHTRTHRDLTRLSNADVLWEIARGTWSTLHRPPYGARNTRTDALAASLGYRTCLWGISAEDSAGAPKTVAQIRATVMNGMAQNRHETIILFHFKRNSLEALKYIIQDAWKQGRGWCRIGVKPAPKRIPNPIPC